MNNKKYVKPTLPTLTGLTYKGKPIILSEYYHGIRQCVEMDSKIAADVAVLIDSIAAHGIDVPILVLETDDACIVLDGYRRCMALAKVLETQETATATGETLSLPCLIYTGDKNEDAIKNRIMRAALGHSTLTDGEKKKMIIAYILDEYARGIYRSGNWVAADLCVNQKWLQDVRNEAVRTGDIPHREKLQGEDKRWMPANIKQPKRNSGTPDRATKANIVGPFEPEEIDETNEIIDDASFIDDQDQGFITIKVENTDLRNAIRNVHGDMSLDDIFVRVGVSTQLVAELLAG